MKNIVLLISPDFSTASSVSGQIGNNYNVSRAGSPARGLDLFKSIKTGLVLMDTSFPDLSDRKEYKAYFSSFWKINPETRFITLTQRNNLPRAVKTVEAGASRYLIVPEELSQLNLVLESLTRHLDSSQPNKHFIGQDVQGGFSEMLKTRSQIMKRVFEKVSLVSRTETTVLLTGETGVGKGVIANLIHTESQRSAGPMLSVHCGAIPEPLIESELFGHEKGAFTGAIRNKKGKFAQAAHGTIFLDEIGTVTSAIQIKLLQVLQDRTFQPVGSDRPHAADVRVIAASNSDLEQMVSKGEFRKDLYFRLNIFPIDIPPLRLRKEDLPLFISFFIDQLNSKHEKRIKGISPEAMEAFNRYDWPGNIREMENLLQRAFILETQPFLMPSSFPADLFTLLEGKARPDQGHLGTLAETRKKAADKAEFEYLCAALKQNSGKINQTAQTSGITRRQLHKLLSKHGIRKEDYKK